MSTLLQAGDVVLTRGNSALARAIRWGQTSRGEEPTLVNHALLVHTGGEPRYARIVESDVRVRYGMLGEFHAADYCYVFRPLNISPTQLSSIVNQAFIRIGEEYGYSQLLTQLVDNKLFGGRVLARRLFEKADRAVCSRLVAEAFAHHRYDFGVPSFAADPDQIFDFCTDNVEKYALVWQGLPGRINEAASPHPTH